MTGPLDLAIRIAELLDDLGIPYVIGGSIASSLVGEPRATVDIDLAVKMSPSAADAVIAAFSDEFYIDAEAVREAVREHRAFNIIHLPSMQKADIFVLGDTLLDRRQIQRRRRLVVIESPRTQLWVGSTEDQVLRKLSWFRQGGDVSDRQWRDVVGLLVVNAHRVDREDLMSSGSQLGLGDLVERALDEADSL